jgi:hypothetical protein
MEDGHMKKRLPDPFRPPSIRSIELPASNGDAEFPSLSLSSNRSCHL